MNIVFYLDLFFTVGTIDCRPCGCLQVGLYDFIASTQVPFLDKFFYFICLLYRITVCTSPLCNVTTKYNSITLYRNTGRPNYQSSHRTLYTLAIQPSTDTITCHTPFYSTLWTSRPKLTQHEPRKLLYQKQTIAYFQQETTLQKKKKILMVRFKSG